MTHLATAAVSLWMVMAAPPAPPKADPNPASLIVSKENEKAASELIKKLASKSFTERDEATNELREMGRLALGIITHTLENESNPEVRLRCEILLPKATADDIHARLDCFLADKEAKYDHKLPGAKQFFAAAGTSEASRNLFRELALSPENRPLLFAAGGKPNDLLRIVVERRAYFTNRTIVVGGVVRRENHVPNFQDAVTLLFIESLVSEQTLGRNTGTGSVAYMLSQQYMRDALASDKTREPISNLISKWVETRTDAYSLYTAMNSARSQNLPHLMPCAKRLLDPKVTGPGVYKAMAMTHIARIGTPKDDLASLEVAFKDETLATTIFIAANKRYPVQMRDVALAMGLLMVKEDPTTYGMKSRYPNQTNESLKFIYNNFYFDDENGKAEENRKAAFKKWDEWKAKQEKEKK